MAFGGAGALVPVPLETLARELDLPRAPGTPGPLSLADADALAAAVRDAGFEGVRTERRDATTAWEFAKEFVRFLQAVSAPFQNLLAGQTPERRDEVCDAIEEAMARYAESDGTLRLPNEVIYLVARR